MAHVDVEMPKMGESITEGTVIAWHKQPGDRVEQDEILLEIGTDKVDTEVPSPEGGVLTEMLVDEGDTVEVGTIIARVETEPEAAGATTSDEPPAADAETEATADASPEPSASDADDADTGTAEPNESAAPEPDTGGEEVEVVMPKMGESITEGTVIAWYKDLGDRVMVDETLLEIGTDKVDTEVPSPAEGILTDKRVDEGETVEVGTVIAVLAAANTAITVPTSTVSPSSTRLSVRIPSAGDGTSVSTLSVPISRSVSSTITRSPRSLYQAITVPSVMLSPILGITTSTSSPPVSGSGAADSFGSAVPVSASSASEADGSGEASAVASVSASAAGGSSDVVAPAASGSVSTRAMMVPTSTVSPSSTSISVSTPPSGDGTSVSTLSVPISRRISSCSTRSPGCLCQAMTVPSVMLSPILGISTSTCAMGLVVCRTERVYRSGRGTGPLPAGR